MRKMRIIPKEKKEKKKERKRKEMKRKEMDNNKSLILMLSKKRSMRMPRISSKKP